MKYAIVTWLDAHYSDADITAHEANDLVPMATESVGMVIAHVPAGIVIATDSFPQHPGTFKHRHFIPSDMIVSVRYLEPLPDPMVVELVDDD